MSRAWSHALFVIAACLSLGAPLLLLPGRRRRRRGPRPWTASSRISKTTSSCSAKCANWPPISSSWTAGPEADDQLIGELIEQWVVRNEAEQAQFAQPPAAGVDAKSAHPRPLPQSAGLQRPLGRRRTHRENVAPNRRAADLSRAISRLQIPSRGAGGRRCHLQVLPGGICAAASRARPNASAAG